MARFGLLAAIFGLSVALAAAVDMNEIVQLARESLEADARELLVAGHARSKRWAHKQNAL